MLLPLLGCENIGGHDIVREIILPLRYITVILYLHNTIIHRFNPPKNLHRHCFRFPWGHLHVPGEIANNDYAKFWGVKEVYYGISASREYVIILLCNDVSDGDDVYLQLWLMSSGMKNKLLKQSLF